MPSSEPVREIRRLGAVPPAGGGSPIAAIAMAAERAVDAYAAAYARSEDRAIALDILLRDLARLRVREPDLGGLIAVTEGYIDGLHRALARRAA